MNKKYKFTGETLQYEGITLHRIQALRSFGDVKEGDIGGWIEKESNLSHYGNCWVGEEAWVCEDARVSEDAQIYGSARVYGHAQVFGSARVHEYAQVFGSARVHEHVQVCENDLVFRASSDILPEELKTLPESIEEVTIKGVKYKKVTVTTIKWERA